MNIGYKLMKNAMSATADKAPYLGMAVPVGSLAYDNILKDMIKTGTRLSLPTARFFLEAFYEFAAERIAEEVVRINTGTVAIYPMIDGSFDSEDAEFDPERNSLYIVATLTVTLVEAVPVPPPAWVPEVTRVECNGSDGVIVNGKTAYVEGSHLSGITAENFSEKVTLVSEEPAASHIRLSFVSLFENSMEFDVGFEEGFDPSEAEDELVTLQIRCPDANGNEHLCEIDVAFHAA